MAPTKDDIKIALDAMRADAGVWTNASDEMTAAGVASGNLILTQAQLGWAAQGHGIVTAYTEVQQKIVLLLSGAQDEFDKVANSLRTAADTYEQQEHHTAKVMNRTGR